ncbi:MAG TPA: VWA domain-containing protein [Micromonosporaceae bacterium]|nr:VWA domain-containing protein [Micromonosporaceae bacterium]
MTFHHPLLLVVAAVVTAAAVTAYVLLQRRRTAALSAAGLTVSGAGHRRRVSRHLPYVLLLAAVPLLMTGLARPETTVPVPRAAGTVVLLFDVSNSMAADDVEPTRLGAAQAAATEFVRAQPDSVDIGVVMFGQQALTTQQPTDDHERAVAAINRLRTGGGTSLGQAILAAMSTIVGEPVSLPDPDSAEPPPDLGYWGSATIVLFSDGEETGGPDAEAAADLAARAGVRIETIGIGTAGGATVEVDGFQLATALDEELLTSVAGITGGEYRPAGDAGALANVTDSIELRVYTQDKPVELTAVLAGAALLLLVLGSLLMTRAYGRLV